MEATCFDSTCLSRLLENLDVKSQSEHCHNPSQVLEILDLISERKSAETVKDLFRMFAMIPIVVTFQGIVSGEVFITEGAIVLSHVSHVLGFHMVGQSGLIRRTEITLSATITSRLFPVNTTSYCFS